MDDIDDEAAEDGALEAIIWGDRSQLLMAEVNGKVEFVTLRSQLSMQLRQIWSAWWWSCI